MSKDSLEELSYKMHMPLWKRIRDFAKAWCNYYKHCKSRKDSK